MLLFLFITKNAINTLVTKAQEKTKINKKKINNKLSLVNQQTHVIFISSTSTYLSHKNISFYLLGDVFFVNTAWCN